MVIDTPVGPLRLTGEGEWRVVPVAERCWGLLWRGAPGVDVRCGWEQPPGSGAGCNGEGLEAQEWTVAGWNVVLGTGAGTARHLPDGLAVAEHAGEVCFALSWAAEHTEAWLAADLSPNRITWIGTHAPRRS